MKKKNNIGEEEKNMNNAPKNDEHISLSLTNDNAQGAPRNVELPVTEGTLGPKVIDIRKLYNDTGMFTYDPGFTSTASCQSAITYIDGEKGQLLHRGYCIEELANKSNFLEVAYLLLKGQLPNKEQYSQFDHEITFHTMLHEQLIYFFRGFRRDSHPMAIMVGVVGALSSFYHDSLDIQDPEQRELASLRLICQDAHHRSYGI